METFRARMLQRFPDAAALPINILARFLMGYGFQLPEAESRFAAFFAWTRQTGVLALRPTDFPAIDATRAFRIIGRTRAGHAVVLVQLRRLQIRAFSPEEFGKYVGSVVSAATALADPTLDSYYMIIDVKDYGRENFDLEGLKGLMPVFSNYFPDVLYRQAIVNIGFFTSKIFSLVMLCMHEVTRQKIRIVKEDPAQIRATLLEDIDLDNIPPAYGGTSAFQLDGPN